MDWIEGLSMQATAGIAEHVPPPAAGLPERDLPARVPAPEDISSPVGISQTLARSSQNGIEDYLWVLGLISLSLALMNLLPLLPLDGGHIAFSIIEGVRGRAVGREIYERVSVIGIALVLFLFFIGLSNDLNRLGGS